MAAAARRAEWFGIGAIVSASLLWGSTFVVIRDSLHALDPVALVASRFAIATLLLAGGAAWHRPRFDRPALVGGALGGLCAAGGYLFQAVGLRFTAAGTSAFLTSTGTLFAGLMAWPLLGQRPTAVLLCGIALAMCGAGLLPAAGGFHMGPGEWWTLGGAGLFALQIVVLARYAPRSDTLALASVQAAILVLSLAPFARPAAHRVLELNPSDLCRVGYLAVAGSTLAPLLHVAAQRVLPAGRVGLLFALEPVFALLFAITAGRERFAGPWWLGAALILLGVIGVEAAALRAAKGSS